MKETLNLFAVMPPDESYLDEFKLVDSLSRTPDGAWKKFCYPALRREGYEKDGFRTEIVTVTIEMFNDFDNQ